MAKLTPAEFQAKYNRLFADNEIEDITEATFREWTLDVADSFASQSTGPNATVGGLKLVIYQTKEEAIRAGRPDNATLDQLNPLTVVTGNLARIDITPDGPTWLESVWDDGQGPYPYGPGFLGLLDGSGQLHKTQLPYSGGLAAMKWVRKDSPEARSANVALYKAGTNYRGNDLVRALFGTFPDVKSVVFYSNESGNDIPAPSRPEGDAYWTVFNPPPPVSYPFQTVTPDELRQLQADAKLVAGRLYIVSPRLIPNDPEDRSYPDLFIRALLESELEPTGYLLVAADDKPLVAYDLATDTTTPAATGSGASMFAELTDSPYDNEPLAEALGNKLDAALASPFAGPANRLLTNTELQSAFSAQAAAAARPFCVVQPDGLVRYLLFWSDLNTVPAGSQVRLRGSYGDANTDYAFQNEHTLVLEPGSVFTCKNLYLSGGPAGADGWKTRYLEGTGTLRGRLMCYGYDQTRATVKNIRHEGQVEFSAYANQGAPRLSFELRVSNVEAVAPAGQNYLLAFHKNGNFYTAWYQVSLYSCRISALGAAAIKLYAYNNDAANDADGRANDRLRIVNSLFFGDGANKVLDTSQSGVATYQFGGNFLEKIAAPTEAADAAFQGWGVGGGGGSSTPSKPAAPTITSQADTDYGAEVVFAANADEPRFAAYEWRVTTADGFVKEWRDCTGFSIIIGNEDIPAGGFELRQKADTDTGGLAGKSAVSTVVFTLKQIFGVTFKMPRVTGKEVVFKVIDNSDGNTLLRLTNLVTNESTQLLNPVNGDKYFQVNSNNGIFTTLAPFTLAAGSYEITGDNGNGGKEPPLKQRFVVL